MAIIQVFDELLAKPRILEQVRSCLLFSGFTSNQLNSVIQSAHIIFVDGGDLLFRQEQEAKHFYQLSDGQIKLCRSSEVGREKVFDIISPSQTFAEAVMFLKVKHYPVRAEAIIPSVAIRYEIRNYLSVLHSSNEACMALLGRMSQRLHWQLTEIDRLTLQDARTRIVEYLLEHVPNDKTDRAKIELRAPKHIIASRLSIKPETLSRIFAHLTSHDLIKVEENFVVINDLEKFRMQMCESKA